MSDFDLELTNYKNKFSTRNKLYRLSWTFVWFMMSLLFPRSFGNKLKIKVLKLFGAEIGQNSKVYSWCKIYMPSNLKIGRNSTIDQYVNIYNVDEVIIGNQTIISSGSFICSASHDISSKNFELIHKPIYIDDNVWIGANAFIGMGVVLRTGCVIGASSSVFKDVQEYHVVGGNPCNTIKIRKINK